MTGREIIINWCLLAGWEMIHLRVSRWFYTVERMETDILWTYWFNGFWVVVVISIVVVTVYYAYKHANVYRKYKHAYYYINAECADFERRRREDWGAEGAEGVWCAPQGPWVFLYWHELCKINRIDMLRFNGLSWDWYSDWEVGAVDRKTPIVVKFANVRPVAAQGFLAPVA